MERTAPCSSLCTCSAPFSPSSLTCRRTSSYNAFCSFKRDNSAASAAVLALMISWAFSLCASLSINVSIHFPPNMSLPLSYPTGKILNVSHKSVFIIYILSFFFTKNNTKQSRLLFVHIVYFLSSLHAFLLQLLLFLYTLFIICSQLIGILFLVANVNFHCTHR